MVFAGVMEGTDKYWELQKPLLWICHNFRDVVYPDVFGSRMLALYSSQHNMFSLLGNRPQTYGQFDSSAFHLTKELAIEIDMWDVLTGRILELLPPRICKGHAFPQADTIKLIFSAVRDKLENLTRLPGDATAKVNAFVRRIQKMAPAAHDIAVVAFVAYQKLSPPVKSHFVDLLAQLYQTATRITHNYPEYHVFKKSQLDTLRTFVHLKYSEIRCQGFCSTCAAECIDVAVPLSQCIGRL